MYHYGIFFQYGGCGQKRTANHKTQLKNLVDRNFLIVLLRRAVQGEHGMEINSDRIMATGDIEVQSKNGIVAKFSPIAIIEHSGIMDNQGETRGHYVCDVKTKNKIWFHTDDNNTPKKIDRKKVTKTAAVILYAKQ